MAEVLHEPDPYILLEVLPMDLFNAWDQYEKQYGFRDDLFWAVGLTMFANANRGEKSRPFEPSDFMLYCEKPPVDPLQLAQKIRNCIREKLAIVRAGKVDRTESKRSSIGKKSTV